MLVPLIEILYLGSTWALDGLAFYELQNSQSFFDQEFDKVEDVCLSSKLLDYQSKLFSNGFLVSLLDNTRLSKECNKKILEALSAKKVTNSHSLFFLHILYQHLNAYKKGIWKLWNNYTPFSSTITCCIYIVLYWPRPPTPVLLVTGLCCLLMAKEIYLKYTVHWVRSQSYRRKAFFFSRNKAFTLEFLFSDLTRGTTSHLCQLLWQQHCHKEYFIANMGYSCN